MLSLLWMVARHIFKSVCFLFSSALQRLWCAKEIVMSGRRRGDPCGGGGWFPAFFIFSSWTGVPITHDEKQELQCGWASEACRETQSNASFWIKHLFYNKFPGVEPPTGSGRGLELPLSYLWFNEGLCYTTWTELGYRLKTRFVSPADWWHTDRGVSVYEWTPTQKKRLWKKLIKK